MRWLRRRRALEDPFTSEPIPKVEVWIHVLQRSSGEVLVNMNLGEHIVSVGDRIHITLPVDDEGRPIFEYHLEEA